MRTAERKKINDRFEYPLVLDMRPFVDGGSLATSKESTSETSEQEKQRLVLYTAPQSPPSPPVSLCGGG